MSDVSRLGLARTVHDMLAEVPSLHSADTPQAIPHLARYSRQAPGWLRIAMFGALRLALYTTSLIVLCILLLRVIPFLLITPIQFLFRWSDAAGWLTIVLCVPLTILWMYQSNNVRSLLNTIDGMVPQSTPSYLQWSRAVIAIVGKVAALIITTLFLLATFLPISFALVNGVEWLATYALLFLPIVLPVDFRWIVIALSLALFALIIGRWVLRIREGKPAAEPFALAVLWVIGLYFWFRLLDFSTPLWLLTTWDTSFLPQSVVSPLFSPLQEIMASLDELRQTPLFGLGSWVVMTLFYPLGIAFWFSRWPVRLLRGLLATLVLADERIRLRLNIGRALRHHRERNGQLTEGYGWSTVCQKDLRRFQLVTERLAYGRWLNYANCPVCNEDQPTYTHVHCCTLLFDNEFRLAEEQQGQTLFFNGLQWLVAHRNRNGDVHVPFESVQIGAVDELDIEEFQTVFVGLNVDRPLKQLSVQTTHAPLADSNALRQLESEIGTVVPTDAAFSCNDSLAQRLAAAEQNVKVRFAAIHMLRTGLTVVGVLALIVSGVFAWRWWSERDKLASEIIVVEIRVTPTPKQQSSTINDALNPEADELIPSSHSEEPTAPVEPMPETQIMTETDGMLLLLVPEGEFEMGDADGLLQDATRDEYPAHAVYLDAFYIDAYEVSNIQYRACEEAGVCAAPVSNVSYSHVNYHTDAQFDDFPVIKVSWFDAETYCNWAGRRLPTEAEWEKAARWSPLTNDVQTYPWGNDPATVERAVFAESTNDPVAVSSLAEGQSPTGVFHMAGNVWEWVADWYAPDYYGVAEAQNPSGPDNGLRKVVRGGSYGNGEWALRGSARFSYPPNSTLFDTGFRCVQDFE